MLDVNFDTITNRVPATLAAGSLPNCDGGVFNYPAWKLDPPASGTSSYRPYEQTAWRNDPSKGRPFKKLSKNGEILASNYSVGTDIKRRYLVERPREDSRLVGWYTYFNGACCAKIGPMKKTASWTERFAFRENGPNAFDVVSSLNDAAVNEAIATAVASTQSSAYAAASNAYDLLTEIAELRETFQYALSKVAEASSSLQKFVQKDPDAHRRAKNLTATQLVKSTDKALRRYGSRWMEYRYAIMPLVYSFKDIASLMDDHNDKYSTERNKSRIILGELMPRPTGPANKPHFVMWEEGEIVVRSWVKSRYDIGSLQRLADTIGFNPFRTAWELIPMSFVVDWFLNVGDVIASQTSLDYSSQRVCCSSVRVKAQTIAHFVDKTADISTRTQNFGPCGTFTETFSFPRNIDQLVYTRDVNSYRRFLFVKPEATITFDPYLSWKRVIDGLVLGYQPVKSILRSLK